MRNSIRFVSRALWFAVVLLGIKADYLLLLARHGGKPTVSRRARWLSRASRRVLRIFGIKVRAEGRLPGRGLLVSNHLSYLDILVISSLVPARFVSKHEVMYWPVFGWLARMARTIFVRRTRRQDAGIVGDEIRAALRDDQLVVLFPEGTSTNGREVLPFKSSLLEPAINSGCLLHIAAIHYTLAEGSAEDDVCFWGDTTFFPHFTKLMTRRNVRAFVRFAEIQHRSADRKELAQQLRAEVIGLKETLRTE